MPEVDAGRITDPLAQVVILALESRLAQALEALGATHGEIRWLRDDVSQFKGEQGWPAGRPCAAARAHSSEGDRPEAAPGVPLGRLERRPLADARFGGYEDLVVQDLELRAGVL